MALPILAMVALFCGASLSVAETVRDRLWIWGRPAGIYNKTHFRAMGLRSTVEPVDGAEQMGIVNTIFIATDNLGSLDEYYRPFRRLSRVYWSLVAAGGGTSQPARESAFALAEKNENVVGFILDDFFHEPSIGNAADQAAGAVRAYAEELRTLRQRRPRVHLPIAVIYTGH